MKTLKLLICMVFLFSAAIAQKSKDFHLLVGTYSNKDKTNGIYVYRFDTQSGEFKSEQPVTVANNASYLAISADRKNVYAVVKGTGAGVNA